MGEHVSVELLTLMTRHGSSKFDAFDADPKDPRPRVLIMTNRENSRTHFPSTNKRKRRNDEHDNTTSAYVQPSAYSYTGRYRDHYLHGNG